MRECLSRFLGRSPCANPGPPSPPSPIRQLGRLESRVSRFEAETYSTDRDNCSYESHFEAQQVPLRCRWHSHELRIFIRNEQSSAGPGGALTLSIPPSIISVLPRHEDLVFIRVVLGTVPSLHLTVLSPLLCIYPGDIVSMDMYMADNELILTLEACYLCPLLHGASASIVPFEWWAARMSRNTSLACGILSYCCQEKVVS